MESVEYLDITEQLISAKNNQQILEICQDFTRKMGFDYFLFGLCNPSFSLNNPNIQIITDYPEDWMTIYSSKGLIKDDPVVAFCQEHTVPVVWSNLIKLESYNKPRYLNTMNAAKKYGLKSGVSVPLKSPSGEFGVFSMTYGEVGQEADEKCRNSVAKVQCLANYVLEAMLAISESEKRSKVEDLREKLTQREYECLFWACEGKTAWEISIILKISERTVLFHLSNATTKMGASNRQHAVAKALLLGIIKPNLLSSYNANS